MAPLATITRHPSSPSLLYPLVKQETVQASNTVLTSEVARYKREKQELEEDMRARRELYSVLFGPPSKPAPRNRRKGELVSCIGRLADCACSVL